MSAHYVITDIGMSIIPEAKSKYLRQTAAIAIMFKIKTSSSQPMGADPDSAPEAKQQQ